MGAIQTPLMRMGSVCTPSSWHRFLITPSFPAQGTVHLSTCLQGISQSQSRGASGWLLSICIATESGKPHMMCEAVPAFMIKMGFLLGRGFPMTVLVQLNS